MALKSTFNEVETLHKLQHYLPSQAPLKDFIHHNTLHAFQHLPFDEGCLLAEHVFGYKTKLTLDEYRERFISGQISEQAVEHVLLRHVHPAGLSEWKDRLLRKTYDQSIRSRIGQLRDQWKTKARINLDKETHFLLFRLVSSYVDQGISIWHFPATSNGLVDAIRSLDQSSLTPLFKSPRVQQRLHDPSASLHELLNILVGDERCFERYLFDQQFAHPGWSGMVSVLEQQPSSLLDVRSISLRDFIFIELLLEIDALDRRRGEQWSPLFQEKDAECSDLFEPVVPDEKHTILQLWQEILEWSYYDQVLAGIELNNPRPERSEPRFQAIFCIDDRECSLRRHLEKIEPQCHTYGTPGFFNVEFFFKPEHSQFMTKVCPAPITPRHVIEESESELQHVRDHIENDHSHGALGGWFIAQTLGFLAGIRLLVHMFRPRRSPLMVASDSHMDPGGKLSIEYGGKNIGGLQVGFTVQEMADRVEGLLRSIGLIRQFAPVVYVTGHGASSLNNTYYAGYDCGACCGRPGSANARVFAFMANHQRVRDILEARGIHIPRTTKFIGALHDTTRDEIHFYPERPVEAGLAETIRQHQSIFDRALNANAKERSRRFILTDSHANAEKVHQRVRLRSVSLFEPRPELNHATNCLCIIGRRDMTSHLFLDRRAFLNSYDHSLDPDGAALLRILSAATPVCGGINLEYYFSRTDNHRLGAGTKLPHNVVGLIGLANGSDGDLRPGLPHQMVEMHTPLRLLVIVEQYPDRVIEVLGRSQTLREWYDHQWVHLVAVDPETRKISRYQDGVFKEYRPFTKSLPELHDILDISEEQVGDLPVYKIA